MEKSSVTVNEDDIAYHSANASRWWDPEGPVKLLFLMNPLRVQFLCDALNRSEQKEGESLKGFKILDAACGGGLASEALARLGAEVVGVDVSEELIKEATSHAAANPELGNNRPKYICSSIEAHAEANSGTYDAVIASEVLEHVLDHEVFIKACVQALRPGGHLVLTTPHKTWKAWLSSVLWMETILAVIPRGAHQYKYFVSSENATKILEKYKCQPKQIRSFGYSYKAGKWSWDEGGAWYAMHAQKEM